MKAMQISGRRQATSVKSLAIVADALGASIYTTARLTHRRAGTKRHARSTFLGLRPATHSGSGGQRS